MIRGQFRNEGHALRMTGVDVEVRGGGVFGLAIAWACAGKGASVRVVEKRTVGGGASGGPVGALAPHSPDNWNPKKAFQLESLLMSRDWWANAAETGGIDPWIRQDGANPGGFRTGPAPRNWPESAAGTQRATGTARRIGQLRQPAMAGIRNRHPGWSFAIRFRQG